VTLAQFLSGAVRTLVPASPSARLDAEVLVMHVTGLTRAALITRSEEELTEQQQLTLNALLARRARGEPIAYLTGHREFWSMDLRVTMDVLIPRPETELLVEQALARLSPETKTRVADVGTGSGAVALAIARERPSCRVIATDVSAAALDVARANAARLDIGNIEFRQGEWLEPLGDLTVDVIVSNPPYVAEQDPHLDVGDVRFEPRHALVSGPDGLDTIRHIVPAAVQHLRAGGWLMLEHGADQGPAVTALMERHGYQQILTHRDLAGLPRLTCGCR
jgi:release factor glutamine methyltransferase